MKNKFIILMLACGISLLAACSGDRTPQKGKDTVSDRYGAAKDSNKMDTSKIKSDDNSANGGANLVKDTSKKDTAKKK